jgi:hypothetical protein
MLVTVMSVGEEQQEHKGRPNTRWLLFKALDLELGGGGETKAELPDVYELCLASLSNRVLTRGLSGRRSGKTLLNCCLRTMSVLQQAETFRMCFSSGSSFDLQIKKCD